MLVVNSLSGTGTGGGDELVRVIFASGVASNDLLLETGDYILLENGDKLALE